MLFARTDISQYINNSFEPVWQSLHEVPIVSVDFGGGKVLKRTLNGNIATYIVTADGTVVDILPGIYKPDTYLSQLKELHKLAVDCQFESSRTRVSANLTQYHRKMAAKPVHLTGSLEPQRGPANLQTNLETDTRINETLRRHQIHQKLALTTPKLSQSLTDWLYKEVLHCDLSDPYLGLASTLAGRPQ